MPAPSEEEMKLAGIARDSAVVRSTRAVTVHVQAAWKSSVTRRRAAAAAASWRQVSMPDRLRMVSVGIIAAMGVHILLVLLDTRALEPFTLLVPGALLVLACASWVAARSLARLLGTPR